MHADKHTSMKSPLLSRLHFVILVPNFISLEGAHIHRAFVFVLVNMGFVHVPQAHIVTFDWSVLLFNEQGGKKV